MGNSNSFAEAERTVFRKLQNYKLLCHIIVQKIDTVIGIYEGINQ